MCVPKVHAKEEAGDGEASNRADEGETEREAPVAKRARKGKAAEPSVYIVAAKGTPKSELPEAVAALLGDYHEEGLNHGKKTYQKKTDADEAQVWLYYWDQRDGWDFSGWWFGETVGGAQVYARGQQHGNVPPVRGWRIPHDRPVRNDVVVLPQGHEEELEMGEEERLEKARDLVVNAEAGAEKAIETARRVVESTGDVFEDAIRAVYEQLETQVDALKTVKSALIRHTKAAKKADPSQGADAELSLMGERVDSILGKMAKELLSARERLNTVELQGAEETNARAIDEALPMVMELVSQAELAAETAATDDAASTAREYVDIAREETEKMIAAASGYAPEAKKVAELEFGALRKRTVTAEKRLAAWYGAERSGLSLDPDDIIAKGKVGEDEEEDDEDDGVVELDLDKPEAEILAEATAKVTGVEAKASNALQTSQVVLEGGDLKSIKNVTELLDEQRVSIRKMQKTLTAELKAIKQKPLAKATKEAVQALAPRIRNVMGKVQEERAKAQKQLAKARRQAHDSLEVKSAKVTLPSVAEAVRQAEEAVDMLILGAGDEEWQKTQMDLGVEAEGEYGEAMRAAVEETQAAADRAQAAVTSARSGIEGQVKAARKLEGEAQTVALDEIAPLRQALVEAQKKLTPYKQARSKYEERLKLKQELEEITSRLAIADVEFERISSAVEPGLISSEEDLEEAERAIPKLAARLAKVLVAVDRRRDGSDENATDKLVALQERTASLMAKTEGLKSVAVDGRKGFASRLLVRSAEEEVLKAEEWGAQIDELQKHWIDAEVLPEAKARPLLDRAEALPVDAESAVRLARTVVMEKIIDAKQLPHGAMRSDAEEELVKLRTRMDTLSLKITQLKVDTSMRRTAIHLPKEFEQVAAAESEAKKVATTAAPLAEDVLEQEISKKVKDACAATLKAEKSAAEFAAKARKVVVAKQAEPQAKRSPAMMSVLGKLNDRVTAVEKQLQEFKNGASGFEKSQKTLADQKKELATFSKSIAKLEIETLPLGDERPSDAAEEKMSTSVDATQSKLDAWRATANAMVTPIALKIAMQRVVAKSSEYQVKLDLVKTETFERRGCANSRIYLRKGKELIAKVEKAMAKAEQAEGPFLMGSEAVPAKEALSAVAACEKEAGVVRKELAEVRSWFEAKCAEAATFPSKDRATRDNIDALSGLADRVEALRGKLSQFEGDTETRKRTATEPALGEPAAKVAKA